MAYNMALRDISQPWHTEISVSHGMALRAMAYNMAQRYQSAMAYNMALRDISQPWHTTWL